MSKIKTKTDARGFPSYHFTDPDGDNFSAKYDSEIVTFTCGSTEVLFYTEDAKTIIKLIKKAANL